MQQVKLLSADENLNFALSGEIDSSASENFYAEVQAAYMHDPKNIVFDCKGLTFIDSTTLGTFVKIVKQLKSVGHQVTLTRVQPRIIKLFEICSLDKLMRIER